MSTSVPVKTTKKSFEVIDQLVRLEAASLDELTGALDMPKGTLHGHLKTLVDLGFIINETGRYRPSMKFLSYGTRIRNSNSLFSVSREELNQLSQDTGEHATLIIEENGRGVIYSIVEGYHPAQLITREGIRTYLHTNACGKAMLAYMDRERVEKIIDEHGLPAQTDETITDRETLFEELKKVRKQGYATNEDEALKGMKAVGAAVRDTNDEIVGAVSVFGPSRRIDNTRAEMELPDRILEAANVIEVNYNYE